MPCERGCEGLVSGCDRDGGLLLPGEKIEDLQCGGLNIIVRRDGFRYGTDSILLANFVKARRGGHIVELCSGLGAVSLLLSAKTGAARITGIEIQQDLADTANRSAALNGVGGKVSFIAGDIRDIRNLAAAGSACAVAANPPYFSRGSGPGGPDAGKAAAKRETDCDITDVTEAAKWLLGPGGSFFIVYRPERLADLICAMRGSRVEPKEIRPVYLKTGATARPVDPYTASEPDNPGESAEPINLVAAARPSLILVRGVKDAAPGLRWRIN